MLSMLSYYEINLFPAVMLLIIYFNSKSKSKKTLQNKLFRIDLILTITILLVDSAAWSLDGVKNELAYSALWCLNILYFTLTGLIAYLWFFYVYNTIYDKAMSKLRLLAFSMPMIILFISCLTTPLTKFIFYIDDNYSYHRGTVFYLQLIVGFGYLIISAIMPMSKIIREESAQKRKDYICLGCFIIMPIIGGTIQYIGYGILLLWPSTALSMLLVYMNLNNRENSVDSLTKLHNRGTFDKYINSKCASYDEADELKLFLMLIDIDNFKSINDVYGHITGDKALIYIADILRNTFFKSNCFVARYGGDEFAVVMKVSDEGAILKIIDEMHQNLRKFNETGKCPYILSLSLGYACFGDEGANNPEQLISIADQNMYEEKKEHKFNAVIRNQKNL